MVSGRGKQILTGAVFAILILATLSHTLVAPLDHNEHAYVGVAALMDDHALYTDVLFNQMPYSVYLYQGLYNFTGTSRLLLAARLANWSLMLASMFLFFVIARRYSGSHYLALAATVFFTVDPIMMGPMKEASSYMIPMAASLAALLLASRAIGRDEPRPLAALLVGVLLGIALGAKLYYLAILPAFVFAALVFPIEATFYSRLFRGAVPMVTGWIAGLFPVILIAARDVDMFWFNNYVYHTYDPLYFGPHGIPLSEKIQYIRRIVGIQQNIAFIVVFGAAFLLWLRRWFFGSFRLPGMPRCEEVIVVLAAVAASAASVSPNPVWIQHFAFPLPFILLAFSLMYRRMEETDRLPVRLAWAPVVLIALAYEGIWLFIPIRHVANPEAWTVSRVHAVAQAVKREVGTTTPDNPIATLSPLYAAEADLPVYPELGMGPFLYRTAAHLPDERRNAIPVVSPETVGGLMESKPPAAILVGEEGDLDDPFVGYAETHGYEERSLPDPALRLFVAPEL